MRTEENLEEPRETNDATIVVKAWSKINPVRAEAVVVIGMPPVYLFLSDRLRICRFLRNTSLDAQHVFPIQPPKVGACLQPKTGS